jgi:REP element-mobilizing transposase RayT
MARTSRFIIPDEQAVYHVMSRTALDGFPLGDVERDYLANMIKKLSRLYFVEIMGFCIMGNHFHLLVKMFPDSSFSDEEIKKRFEDFYGEEKKFSKDHLPLFRQKWSSLSEFMKEIKQRFSRYYNKKNGRKGFFWGDRFKSVVVENGETLVNCLAYIDLNPVRAGIVERPEDYRWNSLGYHVQTGNLDGFLSLDFGLIQFGNMDDAARLREYRRFVYETGAIDTDRGAPIKQSVLESEKKKGFKITRADRFRHRSRYFSDSCFIGSKEFVQQTYHRYKKHFPSKKDRKPNPITGMEGLFSFRRLQETV